MRRMLKEYIAYQLCKLMLYRTSTSDAQSSGSPQNIHAGVSPAMACRRLICEAANSSHCVEKRRIMHKRKTYHLQSNVINLHMDLENSADAAARPAHTLTGVPRFIMQHAKKIGVSHNKDEGGDSEKDQTRNSKNPMSNRTSCGRYSTEWDRCHDNH